MKLLSERVLRLQAIGKDGPVRGWSLPHDNKNDAGVVDRLVVTLATQREYNRRPL